VGIDEAKGLILDASGATIVCAYKGYPTTFAFLMRPDDRNILRLVPDAFSPEIQTAWNAWCDARATP
jgi:hypothetical protein